MYAAHMRRISSAPDVKVIEMFADEPTFYNLFVNFNRRHRRFYPSLPTIRGATVNLYSLFTAVVKHGGYSKVNEQGIWEKIALEIGCPPACANCNVALRRVYCQYLVAFENESYPHLKNDSIWSQLQDEFNENSGDVIATPSVEKALGIFNPKSSPIHYGMHRSATHLGFIGKDFPIQPNQNSRFPSSFDQLSPSQQLEELHSRPHASNCFDLQHASVMETAEKSLMSGLPNEVDLSLNSILFLSAAVHPSLATPLRLSSSRNILQLMLATVGIFEDGASSLRQLNQAWNSASNLSFDEFWRDAVDDGISFFLREDAYLYQEHSQPLVQDAETAGYRVVPPPSPDTTYDLFSPSSSHARQFFGPIGSAVGCGGDDCLSSNAPLSRVLTVVATLVNCVTPPNLAGLPPFLEEDDDEIEQVMAFASVKNQRIVSGISGLSETGGRPIRGRSLFYSPSGLVPPLSVWRENARFLSSQPSVLRFAFLCAYARHSALRQLGLQLVSGLRYPLNPTTLVSTTKSAAAAAASVPRPLHLNTFVGIELISVRFLVRCLLQSADRCDLLAGLSLLTNLLRVPEGVNVECLFAGLPRFLWCRLIQLLCLSDLGLVCAVLEALYTATGMGGLACTRLWGSLAFVDDTVTERAPTTVFAARRASIHLRPLLALLSLEGQSMGPGSLHRVKVMQRHPQPVPPTSQIVMGSPVMHHLQSFHPHHQSYLLHPQSNPQPQNFLHQASQCPPSSQLESCPHLVPSRSPVLPPQQRPTIPFSPRASASSSLANLLGPSTTPTHNNNSRGLVVAPQIANVKPEVSSLSELTDRLQMPPPQMPPPRRTSNKVNSAAVASSTINGSPLVNGKISSPSVLHNRLSQHQQPSSKSPLDKASNAPSNKTIPHLVNGCISGRATVHASVRNDLVVGAVPFIKPVNGESSLAVNLTQLSTKIKSSLINGTAYDNESVDTRVDEKKLNKGKAKQEDDDGMDEKDEELMEAKLLEAATFFTHYLCFNRNVGFHYTRKRSRDFALRNRILKGTTTTSSSSSSSAKRIKVDLKNNSDKSRLPQHQSSLSSQPMFVCEWRGCLQRFPAVEQLSCHVYKSHIKPSLPAFPAAATSSPIERHCCQWSGCSSAHLPRGPFALMAHLLEHHCSPGELELRRQSIAIPTSTNVSLSIASPSISSPLAAGLPDQSGWSIIREVEAHRLKSDLWMSQCAVSGRYYSSTSGCGGGGGGGRIMPPTREGPVTKHLRVTAALILRNLARHVPEARRWLLSETPLLCEIAMGTCPGASSLRTNDASRVVAQCLSICTSHHLHSHSRCDGVVGFSGDEGAEDYSFCCCADDDYFYNDDDDSSGGYCESSSSRLPLLRQRSSVDLDA